MHICEWFVIWKAVLQPEQFGRANKIAPTKKEPEVIYCDERNFALWYRISAKSYRFPNVSQNQKKSIFIGFYLAKGLKCRWLRRRTRRFLFMLPTKLCAQCMRACKWGRTCARVHNVFHVYVRQSGVSFGCAMCVRSHTQIKIEVVDAAQKGSRKWYSFLRIWAT